MCVCVQVYYAKFPPHIDKRQILLLHPVLGWLVVRKREPPITIPSPSLHRHRGDNQSCPQYPEGTRGQGGQSVRGLALRDPSWCPNPPQGVPQYHHPHLRSPHLFPRPLWRHLLRVRLTKPPYIQPPHQTPTNCTSHCNSARSLQSSYSAETHTYIQVLQTSNIIYLSLLVVQLQCSSGNFGTPSLNHVIL